MNATSAIGGLAGACTLTLASETVKRLDKDAPRLDLLGANAIAKLLKESGFQRTPPLVSLLPVALSGDLISNALYYSLAKSDDREMTMVKGALLGLGAGLGAIALTKPLGLEDDTVNRTTKTSLMTVGWYVLGGIVAAAAMNMMQSKAKETPVKS